jgi:DNA-binding NarL/FixJ family response regulator
MSGHDLYLVLRERLEAVADTIHIDAEILDEAQNARGFSHERMARELYISEKTWRRWKAKAAIPADRLDDVARVLNLDIERPPARRVVLAEEASRLVEAESATAAALVVLDGRLEDIAATVAVLAKGQAEMLAALQGAAREERGLPRVRPRRRTAAE